MNNMTYDEFLKKIENDIPFALSRWGDGEWLNIRQLLSSSYKLGKNCDGNYYYPDLGAKLKSILLQKQNYYMGCQMGTNMISDRQQYKQDWFDSDFLHMASLHGGLEKFILLLNHKHVVYIGNSDLKQLEFIDEFIEIPPNNVWLDYSNILKYIENKIEQNIHKIFLFSAGMATNVFIDDLWKRNQSNSYIDVGSVFDPYVGKQTRSYHKNLNFKNNK